MQKIEFIPVAKSLLPKPLRMGPLRKALRPSGMGPLRKALKPLGMAQAKVQENKVAIKMSALTNQIKKCTSLS